MTVNVVLNCPLRTVEVVHLAVRGTPQWSEPGLDGDYFEFGADEKFWFVTPREVETVNEEGETVVNTVLYKDQLGVLRVQLNPGVVIQLDSKGLNAAADVGLLVGGAFVAVEPPAREESEQPVSGVGERGWERNGNNGIGKALGKALGKGK